MYLRLLCAAIAGSVLFAGAASATITPVSGIAGLTQGPYTLETFDDLTLEPGVTGSSATGLQLAGRSFAPSYPSGTTGLTTNVFPDPITLTFGTAASSVGLFFGNDDTCCARTFSANLDIFSGATLLDTISVTANMNDAVDQFIGFISDESVTSVTIRYGSGTNVGLFHVIDDLRFNAASDIPVPAPLALLGMGMAIIGLARRRLI